MIDDADDEVTGAASVGVTSKNEEHGLQKAQYCPMLSFTEVINTGSNILAHCDKNWNFASLMMKGPAAPPDGWTSWWPAKNTDGFTTADMMRVVVRVGDHITLWDADNII